MRYWLPSLIGALCLLVGACSGPPDDTAARADYLPPGAVPLFPDSITRDGGAPWYFEGDGAPAGITRERRDGLLSSWIYSKFVPAATDPIWEATLMTLPFTEPLDSGEVIHGYFDIRADFDGIQNESNTGSYEAYLQATDEGWESLANFSARPGPAWKRTYFTGRATRDYPAGAINLALQIGTQAQIISVDGLHVYRLPADTDVDALPVNVLTYEGREPDAPWRSVAAARIDEHRRGTLTVRVLDEAGRPRAGVPVDVALTAADFRLGTIVHGPDDFDDPADYRRWRDTTLRYFDAFTTSVYPTDEWGWQNPDKRRRDLEKMDWALAQGHPVRAHVLVWPGWRWSPKAWRELADAKRGDELRARVNAHVREVMDTLSRRDIDVVDVFNEPRVNHDVDDAVGAPSPRPDWFRIARETAPEIRLAINEFGVVSGFGTNAGNIDGYIEDIRDILEAGGEIDVVGVQGHIGEGFTPPERLWAVFDRLAALGRPLHVTEFDVATDDDAVQADYTRDFLTAALAHPSVEQVTFWGYWEPHHWRPAGALWGEDWRRLPAAEALAAWRETFWRKPDAGLTDARGEVRVRVMAGRYAVRVGGGLAQEVNVTAGRQREVTVGE